MITYLDESVAGEPPLDVLALGCVVGTERAWERFAGDIIPVLDRVGVDDLHRTDLVGRKKAFDGWPRETCDGIIREVDTFIVGNALQCFTGAAPMWAWRAATTPKKRRRTYLYRMATLLCLEVTMEQVCDFAKGRLALENEYPACLNRTQ